MHDSPRRGYLISEAGKPFTEIQLARAVGSDPKEIRALLEEMRDAGTFSEEDGLIFNRRMVRESKISDVRSEAANTMHQQKRARDPAFAPVLHMQNSCKAGTGGMQSDCKPDTEGRAKPLQTVRARDRAGAHSAAASSSTSSSETAAAAVEMETPAAAAAIRERFPGTDDGFIREIRVSSQKAVSYLGPYAVGLVTDETIAQAVKACWKPGQRSAGLYAKTVPQCIAAWVCSEVQQLRTRLEKCLAEFDAQGQELSAEDRESLAEVERQYAELLGGSVADKRPGV